MCGIVGLYSFNGPPVDAALLARMRDTMTHRGPDGEGLWVSPERRVGLGHRRLSIVDLSPSAGQPMSNEDESLRVVFNGEIYNHAEIRADLERIGGHHWRTDHSDTEVILHAYDTWGLDCLERFRGMFAFALWDSKRQEMVLVRDRIGIKPLYYSLQNGRLTFASEIKALLLDPAHKRALNETAFYHYLSFLTTPAPETLFQGIQKLSPGTWMKIKADGSIQTRRYWDVCDHTRPLVGISENEISERLLAELRTSVKLRKVSDVPVGVFLSGGVDSSSNAVLFAEGEQKPIRTFTIGYDADYGSYQNEFSYARQVATAIGAEHKERTLKVEDLISFLPSMIHYQEEPIADPVCVPLYYISKLARESGVVVCQVGEGADELFFGYPPWKMFHRLALLNEAPCPRVIKKLGLSLLRMAGKQTAPYYEWLRRGAEQQPIFWGGTDIFPEGHKEKLLSPRLRQQFKGYSSFEALRPYHDHFMSRFWEKTPLNWMSYVDLHIRLPELLLMRVDKMTMATGLEARVPFLDHKFVELAMSIPENIKFKNGQLKYILKKAVGGLIPANILSRKKQGFGVPIYEWFFGQLGTLAKEELLHFCDETDLLDKAEVLRLFSQQKWNKLWFLFNFALWRKKAFNS